MPDLNKRFCYYVDPTQARRPEGFIPSAVFEDDPGHYPMLGNGPGSAPWYWGETIEEAKEACREENDRLGLSEQDVADIIASSMRAQNQQERKRREWHGEERC